MPLREKVKLVNEEVAYLQSMFISVATLAEFDLGDFDGFLAENYQSYLKYVNVLDEQFYSLLHHAVRKKLLYAVNVLVKRLGADVNIRTADGVTPLHMAVKRGKEPKSDDNPEEDTEYSETDDIEFAILNILFSHGADVNAIDGAGWTPLFYAINLCNLIGVEALLFAGANIEIADKDGLTPALLAAKRGFDKIMSLLIKAKCKLSSSSVDGCGLLHLACIHEPDNMLTALHRDITFTYGTKSFLNVLNLRNHMDETPLHWAAKYSGLPLVLSYIKLGADLHQTTRRGESLMHMAAQLGDTDMISCLNRMNMDVDAKDVNEETPIFHAIRYNRLRAVEELIDFNADINLLNSEGHAPIMVAIKLELTDICKVLINSNCWTSLVDGNLRPCIHLAAENKNNKIVKMLAETTTRMYSQSTLYDHADFPDVQSNTAVHAAASVGSISTLRVLGEADADMTSINDMGQTPLHLAARNHSTTCCTYLASKEPHCVTHRDEDGNMPIHEAAMNGHRDILGFFLNSGVEANIGNNYGRTPLYFAATNNHIQCADMLLNKEHNDVNVKDQAMVTPLFMACLKGHLDMVKLLIEQEADPTILVHSDHPQYPSWNALDAAIHAKSMDCAKLIMDSNYWKDAMRNRTVYANKYYYTPLTRMIIDLPEAAKYVFRRMVLCNQVPEDHPDFTIKYMFEYLEVENEPEKIDQSKEKEEGSEKTDKIQFVQGAENKFSGFFKNVPKMFAPEEQEKLKYVYPIPLMLQHNRLELLNSELVQGFLSYKWIKLIIPYMINLLFYMLFVSCFTSFMLQTTAPYFLKNEHFPTIQLVCTHLESKGLKAYVHYIAVAKYGTLILAIISFLKELGQSIRSGVRFLNMQNVVELTVYTSAIIATIDTGYCMMATGLREDWQWQLGTLGVFLAWINVILSFEKLIAIGTYAGMYRTIVYSLAKVALVFSPFILSFAIAFYLILGNQIGFSNGLDAVTKTFSMLSGEINLVHTLFSRYEPDAKFEDTVPYLFLTYILYLTFIALMVIVMVNMIISIAVGDVNAKQQEAANEQTRNYVNTAIKAEDIYRALHISLSFPKLYEVNVNKPATLYDRLFLYLCPSFAVEESMAGEGIDSTAVSVAPDMPIRIDGASAKQIKEYLERKLKEFKWKVLSSKIDDIVDTKGDKPDETNTSDGERAASPHRADDDEEGEKPDEAE